MPLNNYPINKYYNRWPCRPVYNNNFLLNKNVKLDFKFKAHPATIEVGQRFDALWSPLRPLTPFNLKSAKYMHIYPGTPMY